MADWSLSGRRTRFNSRLNKRRRNEIKVKEEKPRGQKASSSHSGTVVSSVLSQRLGNRRSAGSSLFLCQTGSGCLSCSRVNVCFICSTISKNSTHTFTRLSVRSFLFSSSHFSSLPFFSHILQKTYFSGCYWLFYFSISCSTITLCDWLTDWLIDWLTRWLIYLFVFISLFFEFLVHFLIVAVRLFINMLLLPHWRPLIWPGWSLRQRSLAWRPSCYRFPLLLFFFIFFFCPTRWSSWSEERM